MATKIVSSVSGNSSAQSSPVQKSRVNNLIALFNNLAVSAAPAPKKPIVVSSQPSVKDVSKVIQAANTQLKTAPALTPGNAGCPPSDFVTVSEEDEPTKSEIRVVLQVTGRTLESEASTKKTPRRKGSVFVIPSPKATKKADPSLQRVKTATRPALNIKPTEKEEKKLFLPMKEAGFLKEVFKGGAQVNYHWKPEKTALDIWVDRLVEIVQWIDKNLEQVQHLGQDPSLPLPRRAEWQKCAVQFKTLQDEVRQKHDQMKSVIQNIQKIDQHRQRSIAKLLEIAILPASGLDLDKEGLELLSSLFEIRNVIDQLIHNTTSLEYDFNEWQICQAEIENAKDRLDINSVASVMDIQESLDKLNQLDANRHEWFGLRLRLPVDIEHREIKHLFEEASQWDAAFVASLAASPEMKSQFVQKIEDLLQQIETIAAPWSLTLDLSQLDDCRKQIKVTTQWLQDHAKEECFKFQQALKALEKLQQ